MLLTNGDHIPWCQIIMTCVEHVISTCLSHDFRIGVPLWADEKDIEFTPPIEWIEGINEGMSLSLSKGNRKRRLSDPVTQHISVRTCNRHSLDSEERMLASALSNETKLSQQ